MDILYLIIFIALGIYLIDKGKKEKRTVRRQKAKVQYNDYLKSQHWRTTRSEAIKRANYKCQLCGNTKNLQVHHNTYRNKGHEAPSDLICLCSQCHSKFHNKLH